MNPYIYMVETTGSSLTEFPPIFNTFIEMMPENKSTVHALSMLISNRFYKICTDALHRERPGAIVFFI